MPRRRTMMVSMRYFVPLLPPCLGAPPERSGARDAPPGAAPMGRLAVPDAARGASAAGATAGTRPVAGRAAGATAGTRPVAGRAAGAGGAAGTAGRTPVAALRTPVPRCGFCSFIVMAPPLFPELHQLLADGDQGFLVLLGIVGPLRLL